MKRFITVLSSLLVLPAFAEVAPVYYDEVIEYSDDVIEDSDVPVEQTAAAQKSATTRQISNRSTTISRTMPTGTASGTARTNANSRAVASSRTTTSRGTTTRNAKNSGTASRASSASRTTVSARNAQGTKPVTARVGTSNNSVMPGNRSITYRTQSTLTDSGAPLYNANTSRVGVANRRSTARVSISPITTTSTTPTISEEDVSSTASTLTALAELTDYCKAQYAACMDNYCNVLDDNQGRCSCSKNLKNYAKTEAALTKATEDFQDAVQKIKYIGLTGSQIEALFAETEAEISMKSNSDKSQIKSSLDAIKKKIVDISSPTSSSSAGDITSGISIDVNGLLNADFTGGFDMNSFLGSNSSNTSSVSNQRGEQLYKTASNRCKVAVLNSCVSQGIDANVITNSYDLEIDKQCIAYERSLNEANKEMRDNVANATNVLQLARVKLSIAKDEYDLRGCVAAIDSCMQDDYVCGSDYEYCLDPTGKYLANGEIVKGATPGVSGGQPKNTADMTANNIDTWLSGGMYNLYATWNYKDGSDNKNAWGTGSKENLGGYIDAYLDDWSSNYTRYKDTTQSDAIATYLLQKVGYIDSNDQAHGMCASAMKQCQSHTFNNQKSTKRYIPDNEVVRQYLNTTLAKIKVKQDEILSTYAEGCRSDVQSCLSSNGYDESNTQSTVSKTAVNACASEITTCMSAGGYQVKDGVKLTLRAMTDWVASILTNCAVNTYLVDDGIGNGTVVGTSATGTSVQCKPCGTAYTDTSTVVNLESAGGQATTCHCPDGYTATSYNSATGLPSTCTATSN